VRQAAEPVLVQALIAQATVERFDMRGLIWLSGLDLLQRHPAEVRPGQHRPTGELAPVVRPD